MKRILYILLLLPFCWACDEAPVVDPVTYDCALNFPNEGANHPKASVMSQALAEHVEVNPGIQVALRTEDQLIWTDAYGKADIPNNVALEACTPTMVGSISKVFTGVLIMQLHEEGILSVEDPARDWLDPELVDNIENLDQATIRQLLNHTSGIFDYLGAEQFVTALNEPPLLESQFDKLRFAYGRKAYHPVGEKHTYSNSNYVLLGLIIEKGRNMPLWDAVRMYITEPLGLGQTQMGTHDDPIPAGTARPYALSQGRYRDLMPHAVSDAATGDGGIASNMQELMIFAEGIFDGTLMKQETMELMIGNPVEMGLDQTDFSEWDDERYGLGIARFNTPYGTAYGHTGSTSSYNAFLWYWPDTGASLAIGYHIEADGEAWGNRWAFWQSVMEKMFE
ncbi:MAG: serine hydrolase domain-containing protein [Bacteroidota bacterium]